jgi:hypothetical protein
VDLSHFRVLFSNPYKIQIATVFLIVKEIPLHLLN